LSYCLNDGKYLLQLSQKFIRLEKLNFSSRYEVQLFVDNKTLPAAVGFFDTLKKDKELLPVREVRVSNYVSGADMKLYANVSWIPAVGEFNAQFDCI
jgi:hypothetical protein